MRTRNWNNLTFVMQEVFYGHNQGSTFLDDGDLAIIGMLDCINAQEASKPVAGSNLAAHARHIVFSIRAYLKSIEASDEAYISDNWPVWHDAAVCTEEWLDIRKHLKLQAENLMHFLQEQAVEDVSPFAFGALAHMAFHLGIIQVKYEVLMHMRGADT